MRDQGTQSAEEQMVDHSQLEDFIGILGRELDLLTRLHSVLVDQQRSLVGGDVEEIGRTVEQQIAIVTEIGDLEDLRKSLLTDIRPSDVGEMDLDAILGVASGEQAERITSIVNCLKEALESLGIVNKRNGMLIRQSMSYIGKAMKMIAGGGSPTETYTSAGGIDCATRQVAVDKQI